MSVATADVAVVGAGLSGLATAIGLADAGASVEVVARGHAATHWTAGGLDVAAPRGVPTSRDGVEALAQRPGHPYAVLGGEVAGAVEWLRGVLEEERLAYVGTLDEPLVPVPTSIGATRRAAILPAGQAAALAPWGPDERLVVCGPARFKDFWPTAIAASLARPSVWSTGPGEGRRPARVHGIAVELPGVGDRHNLTALDLARRFDDPAWRAGALARIAAAVEPLARRSPVRIALPAALGLADHRAVLDDAARILPGPAFEVPLVPPSIPGLRLYHALRAALRRRGGRLLVGEPVVRIELEGRRVTRVVASAAVRDRPVRAGALVLATGGIAGGGLVAPSAGVLEEPLLGLPVAAPDPDRWLAESALAPEGHPLEAAGIRTDADLRPVDPSGEPVLENAAIVGALLAGQRYLAERSGDGVAIASARRAVAVLTRRSTARRPAPAAPTTARRPARKTA